MYPKWWWFNNEPLVVGWSSCPIQFLSLLFLFFTTVLILPLWALAILPGYVLWGVFLVVGIFTLRIFYEDFDAETEWFALKYSDPDLDIHTW
jgi:hypothetical protein